MNEDQKNKTLVIDDTAYETNYTKKFLQPKSYDGKPGQRVKGGDSRLMLEAMKMKNDVTADLDGTVKSVNVKQNDRVMKNQLLIEFE